MQNMNDKIKLEILSLKNDLLQKREINLNFVIIGLTMEKFSSLFIKSEIEKSDDISKAIEHYNEAKNQLNSKNKSFEIILFERNYLNIYNTLEEFFFKIYSILYNHFPKYMFKDEIPINLTDLFEKENIDLLRKDIISKKVKAIIQGSNTYALFKKLETIFGIKLNIDKESLDKIFLISQKRNILVHNQGVVNNIFLKEINKHNITTKLKLNDYVLKNNLDHKELNRTWIFISELLDSISDIVLNNVSRIKKHHENIK